MEKQIDTKEIYNGRVFRVYKDEIELDNGKNAYREVVKHRGGACIALKDKDGKFFMVRQYRYALKCEMLEFCAGKLEENENPDDAIIRETKEELGFTLTNLKNLGYVVPTCGYSNEKIYLYYGEALDYVGQDFDEDENMAVKKYSFNEIKEMIKENKINDAKTMALMYRIEMAGLND